MSSLLFAAIVLSSASGVKSDQKPETAGPVTGVPVVGVSGTTPAPENDCEPVYVDGGITYPCANDENTDKNTDKNTDNLATTAPKGADSTDGSATITITNTATEHSPINCDPVYTAGGVITYPCEDGNHNTDSNAGEEGPTYHGTDGAIITNAEQQPTAQPELFNCDPVYSEDGVATFPCGDHDTTTINTVDADSIDCAPIYSAAGVITYPCDENANNNNNGDLYAMPMYDDTGAITFAGAETATVEFDQTMSFLHLEDSEKEAFAKSELTNGAFCEAQMEQYPTIAFCKAKVSWVSPEEVDDIMGSAFGVTDDPTTDCVPVLGDDGAAIPNACEHGGNISTNNAGTDGPAGMAGTDVAQPGAADDSEAPIDCAPVVGDDGVQQTNPCEQGTTAGTNTDAVPVPVVPTDSAPEQPGTDTADITTNTNTDKNTTDKDDEAPTYEALTYEAEKVNTDPRQRRNLLSSLLQKLGEQKRSLGEPKRSLGEDESEDEPSVLHVAYEIVFKAGSKSEVDLLTQAFQKRVKETTDAEREAESEVVSNALLIAIREAPKDDPLAKLSTANSKKDSDIEARLAKGEAVKKVNSVVKRQTTTPAPMPEASSTTSGGYSTTSSTIISTSAIISCIIICAVVSF